MSQMQIDQVLAQIRSYSSQPAGLARPVAPGGPAASPGASGAPDFGQLLKKGIDAVNETQQSASRVADAYERGAPGVDLARTMIETQKATVAFRALAEVRNRLVTVYQDIMNMPI
jgi:flagellar hook-basal body complex protein FliE